MHFKKLLVYVCEHTMYKDVQRGGDGAVKEQGFFVTKIKLM